MSTDALFDRSEAVASRRTDDVLWDYPVPGLMIGNSPIHGRGLFAARPIGTREAFAQAWVQGPKGMMRTQAGRFVNHSDQPNAVVVPSQRGAVLVALRPIPHGGEVLVDYRAVYGTMAQRLQTEAGMGSWDDDDLASVSIDAAVYGPSPVTPSNPTSPEVRTGNALTQKLAGQYPGFPFEAPPGPLSAQQHAEIQALVTALSNFFYNTQMTAALPAHNTPTNWSTPVDRSGVVTIPAAVDLNWTTICEYDVGPGRWMRIEGYGINVRTPGYTYDGSLIWRLMVNGVPLPTLEGFAEQRGTLVTPRRIFALAQQDQRVALQVRRAVASVAPDDVEGCFLGYIWRLRNDYDGTRASVSAY